MGDPRPDEVKTLRELPLGLRVTVFVIIGFVGLFALPYLFLRQFVRNWRHEFNEEWRRSHGNHAPSDHYQDVRLRRRD